MLYPKQCLCALTIFVVAMFLGCGSGKPDISQYNDTNIEKVRNMYSLYMSGHSFMGPKNKKELRKFLESDAKAKIMLERMELDFNKFDEYFIGTRDNEEFKVRWGLKGQLDHAIVFESTGIDGKRFVALGEPTEVDEADYEGYWSGKIKPAGPGSAKSMAPDEADQQNYGSEAND